MKINPIRRNDFSPLRTYACRNGKVEIRTAFPDGSSTFEVLPPENARELGQILIDLADDCEVV